jgi:hypothetical protein
MPEYDITEVGRHNYTEKIGVEVALETCTQEVVGLNLCRDTCLSRYMLA